MKSLANEVAGLGQTVLVLQGGGALGAYQAGVYEALHEAGIAPQWVIGTSIGAINAALIAGSKPSERIEKLREFWSRVQNDHFVPGGLPAWLSTATRNMMAITGGVPAFFSPNPLAFASPHNNLGPEAAGYYSVLPLRRTLEDLIDLRPAQQRRDTHHGRSVLRADGRDALFRFARHAALDRPRAWRRERFRPAFPPVRIDGELYWDGGILSNTPVEVVFDDNPRRDSLVFAVHIWNPHGPEPETIWEVMNRQKDVQYSSRAVAHIRRQRQIHKMRHIIAELSKLVPEDKRQNNLFGDLKSYGCLTRMHVVRLLAPALDYEDHSKDIDFSAHGIRRRREAGYKDTMETLEKAPVAGAVRRDRGLHLARGERRPDGRDPGGQLMATAMQQSSRSPLSVAVLLGSVRRDRMGMRAAQLVIRELERRGHDVHLVDPLELQLPLLDRMYKEHASGEAPEQLERLATALSQRRRIPGGQRRIQPRHSAGAEEPARSFPRGVFLAAVGNRLLLGRQLRRRARGDAAAHDARRAWDAEHFELVADPADRRNARRRRHSERTKDRGVHQPLSR